jgi:MoaA/NifB/PqqE/SkfB family radical SAM enzyme
MIRMAKGLGCRVELITNGTLLNCETAEKLTDLCLDRLWVSLDGATPKSYSDIRLGDELNGVLDNLFGLVRNRTISKREFPKLGIAFVAMKRNIADLPAVIAIGKTLGADLFSISNVMPHTEELQREILYQKSLYYNDQSPAIAVDGIQFPRMDLNTETLLPLSKFLGEQIHEKAKFPKIPVGANTCPFIEKKSLSIRWDGMVSPCLPLMHTHQNYLDDTRRISHSYSYGDVNLNGLGQIWNDPAYVQFRNRLMDFDFSPCTFCNSCENAESNLEDCFGNIQPACGGCLWAQGFIQCP